MSFPSSHQVDSQARAHLDTLYREAHVARLMTDLQEEPAAPAHLEVTVPRRLLAWMLRLFGPAGAQLPR